MGPVSGRWRLCGNDQQCLAAPIWKYRSGFGDHRFTFFIDLLPNYTFYTHLTNIVHWVAVYRDVAHMITLNLEKVEKKYAKSFDAGLSNCHWNLLYRVLLMRHMVGFGLSWWRHQMEIFSALLAICAGNSPVPGEFPAQRPVTRSFDIFFDLRLNKQLSKQSWGWLFETLSWSLWRHCNVWDNNTLCKNRDNPVQRFLHTSAIEK